MYEHILFKVCSSLSVSVTPFSSPLSRKQVTLAEHYPQQNELTCNMSRWMSHTLCHFIKSCSVFRNIILTRLDSGLNLVPIATCVNKASSTEMDITQSPYNQLININYISFNFPLSLSHLFTLFETFLYNFLSFTLAKY